MGAELLKDFLAWQMVLDFLLSLTHNFQSHFVPANEEFLSCVLIHLQMQAHFFKEMLPMRSPWILKARLEILVYT